MGPSYIKIIPVLLLAAAPKAAVTEAQVFDWWDAGIITPEQAEEFLSLLDEGNTEEACLLAEVYAQESCEEKQESRKKSRATKERRPSLRPTGYALSKIRLDSLGHVESHREELRVSFYRYTLLLGTQELLSYRNAGSEAHLGDISTKEVHNHIPIDTLWGTSLLYPFGNVHLAALLDSSTVTQARAGYDFDRQTSADIAYWHGAATDERHHFHSVMLQTSSSIGKASAWYQAGQDAPLVKIELRSPSTRQGKAPRKSGNAKAGQSQTAQAPIALGWRTTAYYHGDSVPALARLSSTILNSRLWGSQTITAVAKEWLDSRLEANMRIINPLHSDSVSARAKASLQSGPAWARAGISATCLELGDNCRESDWKPSLQSSFAERWTAGSSAKARYTQGEGLGAPRLEFSLRYQDAPGNFAKIAIVAPDGFATNALQLRNEARFGSDFLALSIATTFRRNVSGSLHPSRGNLSIKVLF